MLEPTHDRYPQSFRNWLDSLRSHDANDIRGLIEGIAKLLELLATRIPQGPVTAPIPSKEDRNGS